MERKSRVKHRQPRESIMKISIVKDEPSLNLLMPKLEMRVDWSQMVFSFRNQESVWCGGWLTNGDIWILELEAIGLCQSRLTYLNFDLVSTGGE